MGTNITLHAGLQGPRSQWKPSRLRGEENGLPRCSLLVLSWLYWAGLPLPEGVQHESPW
jgi:hypothetical protein